MCLQHWPIPPIWPEDVPLIRELLTEEEFEELLRRLSHVVPNGPLVDHARVFGTPSSN